MQHHIQTLVKHFFRKETLQEVTVKQLQQFIDDYPYSAVGQLLLAKKLHDTGAQNFEEQGGKASLYFHDPVWAGWLLRHQEAHTDETVSNRFEDLYRAPEPVHETPHYALNLATVEPVEAPADTPPWEEPATAPPADEPVMETIVQDEPEVINTAEPIREEIVASQETNTDLPAEPMPAAPETVNVQAPVAPETAPVQAPAPPEIANTQAPIPAAADNGDDLNFEPYHTIDYFASLGIKLKPEELAKDKLGQQLKSFTDWLRTMKKITPAQQAENAKEMDELTTKSIQRIAEFSNEAKEIITEAMAEVWAKQGHRGKAIEIYEKLSLLNPSKSHYFAARIDALKAQ